MLMRVSFNGRTLASQANNVGSIPITRSTLKQFKLKQPKIFLWAFSFQP
jgi:hypothetical protein